MARPLTKKHADGSFYTRPSTIENAIDFALSDGIERLRERVSTSNRTADGALAPEVLVHLIREARRRDDQRMLSTLLPRLLAICEAILNHRVPNISQPDAPDLREEILQSFAVLFAEDGSAESTNELDFFECRFHAAFRTFRADYLRKARRKSKYMQNLPSPSGDASDDTADDDIVARLSEAYRTKPSQEDAVERSELSSALNSLPSEQREAVVLVYLLGLKEESQDPFELTAAKQCNVTGRTIRNRLRQALASLAKRMKETP